MLATIEGTLTELDPLVAVLEIQGIGYEVHIPLTTMERLPNPGGTVKLYTHAVYRDDSQTLFGFYGKADREFFRLLIEKVSGIGPKIALRIMSRLSVPTLQSAIASSDVALLSKCPGIGRKTAERLVVELKDRLSPATGHTSVSAAVSGVSGPVESVTSSRDAVNALISLGYKAEEADKAVRRSVEVLGPDANTEELIKRALG